MKYKRPQLLSNTKIKNYCGNGSAASLIDTGGWINVTGTGTFTTNMCNDGAGDAYGPDAYICYTGASVSGTSGTPTTVTSACDTGNGAT